MMSRLQKDQKSQYLLQLVMQELITIFRQSEGVPGQQFLLHTIRLKKSQKLLKRTRIFRKLL
jgi:hypothetical protein